MSEPSEGGGQSPLDRAAEAGPLADVDDLDATEEAGLDDSPINDSETIADEYGTGVRPGGIAGH